MHRRPLALRGLIAAIAALAGFVDAVGFVSSGGYFVSFMSGNSTRLGVSAAQHSQAALLALLLVAAFVGGVYLGARRRAASVRARAGGAALALVVAAAATRWSAVTALALTAFAMGLINTFVTESRRPVGLTYVTGALVNLGESLAADARDWRAWSPYLLHWLALVLGAALGAWALRWSASIALLAAAAVTLTLVPALVRLEHGNH